MDVIAAASVLKQREGLQRPHGPMGSDSDRAGGLLQQLAAEPLFRADVAQGLNDCSRT